VVARAFLLWYNNLMNCSIEGCNSKVYARGWCRKHYRHVIEGGHAQPLPVVSDICECGKSISQHARSSGLCRDCYYTKWLSENKEEQIQYKKEYNSKNKEKISAQIRKWRNDNRDKQNAYYAEKRKDPLYRLAHNLRSRLYDFLSGKIKHKNTEDLTGCSFEELQKHLEAQFQPDMTWENYGSYWSVDHIVPFASITTDDKIGLEQICHYSNLRPLTIERNNSKATEDKKWKKA
jgi:hypothetical protein